VIYCVGRTFAAEAAKELATLQSVFILVKLFPLRIFFNVVSIDISELKIPGVTKSSPVKNFANFSRTTERYDIKFRILVTHLLIHKSGATFQTRTLLTLSTD